MTDYNLTSSKRGRSWKACIILCYTKAQTASSKSKELYAKTQSHILYMTNQLMMIIYHILLLYYDYILLTQKTSGCCCWKRAVYQRSSGQEAQRQDQFRRLQLLVAQTHSAFTSFFFFFSFFPMFELSVSKINFTFIRI